MEAPVSCATSVFVNFGDLKTVRIIVCDEGALHLMKRELSWIITEPVPDPDASIVLWREDSPESFLSRIFGLNPGVLRQDAANVIYVDDGDKKIPFAQIDLSNRTVYIADGNTYYCGTGSFVPEIGMQQGHLL